MLVRWLERICLKRQKRQNIITSGIDNTLKKAGVETAKAGDKAARAGAKATRAGAKAARSCGETAKACVRMSESHMVNSKSYDDENKRKCNIPESVRRDLEETGIRIKRNE